MEISNPAIRIPYEGLKSTWISETQLSISSPWMNLTFEVDAKEKPWVQEATELLPANSEHTSVQRFLEGLKDYPLFYTKPRTIEDFQLDKHELTAYSLEHIDFSSPETFIDSLQIPFKKELKQSLPQKWQWPVNDILNKAKIAQVNLYDPITIHTYLSLIRLESAKRGWEGSGGIYNILNQVLHKDEKSFFRYIGWCARQSHYLTSNAEKVLQNAIDHFPRLREQLEIYLADESGHDKFLADVLDKLGFNVNDFELNAATQFFVDALFGMGNCSALAFINLVDFSEAYSFSETDPLSELLKKSSKPNAGKGYQKHYEINFGHDHDMICYSFCSHLGPQHKKDCLLTIRIYELCSTLINSMEGRVENLAFLAP